MAIKTATELKAYFETGDKPTQSQFEDLIDTLFSAVPDYKVYRALISQSGVGAPTATVLENTLGNIIYTYDSAGQYIGTLTGGFTNNKTSILSGSTNNGDIAIVTRNNVDTIIIVALGGDDNLNQTTLEIRVYN